MTDADTAADTSVSPSPASPTAAPALKALWYDGLSSQPRRVLVIIEPGQQGPQLVIEPLQAGAQALVLQAKQVRWPQTYGRGNAPSRLTVDLLEHGTLEVQSANQWHQAFKQAGGQLKVAERLQTGWRILLGFTAVTVLLVFVFLRYGTPIVATQLARFVPLSWERELADTTLEQLDRFMLKPSELSAQRQSDLRAGFERLHGQLPEALVRYGSYQSLWQLEFRRGIGANALALPGGTIIMTDEMVQLAQRHGIDDAALLGVLAHEIGHVQYRHSSRMLIEQGLLNASLSVAVGDVSGWVALAGTGLTSMAYSRAHEREADCFALALMGHQNIPSQPMAELFSKATGAGKDPQKTSEASSWNWLSTHPDSQLRTSAFARGESQQCDMRTGRLQ